MSKTYNKYNVTLIYPISISVEVVAKSEEDAIALAEDNVSVEEYMNETIGAESYEDGIDVVSVNADGIFTDDTFADLIEEDVESPYDDEDDADEDDDEGDDEGEDD